MIFSASSEYRPDLQGIETAALAAEKHVLASEYRPDLQGIETILKSPMFLELRSSEYRPDLQGIET